MNVAMERLKKDGISDNISPAFKNHTDLVPGVYEGETWRDCFAYEIVETSVVLPNAL